MREKLILCVTSQEAWVGVFQRGKSASYVELPGGEPGTRVFGDLLRAGQGVPVYLMVDSVDEDYRNETLPHAAGRARTEMLQRKQKQLHRNATFSTAWLQGREPDQRRDDRYLFVALTNAEILSPWLETLRAAGAPLAGVYLLPMASAAVLQRLDIADEDLLLVSRHGGGLRQSFFHAGQLRASRLALGDQNGSPDGVRLANEIGRTRLYLNSVRLISHDVKLSVLLLDPRDELADLEQRLRAEAGGTCRRLTERELSACAGETAHCPYALHMAALARHPPIPSLAPEELTWAYRHQIQRRWIYAVSALVFGAAVLWSAANLARQYRLETEARRMLAQTRAQQSRYAAAEEGFPAAPTAAENLEAAVLLAAKIERERRDPERLMLIVSRVLDLNSEIILMRLNWKQGRSDAGAVEDTSVDAVETGVIEGEIRPFQGDHRAAMERIDRFAAGLRDDGAVASVEVVQMPLDVHPTSTLSGNTADAGNPGGTRAEFKLAVQLKARE